MISDTQPTQGRLICVSNRLPVTIRISPDQPDTVIPSAGGLVTALAPVLRARKGHWIGWAGNVAADADRVSAALVEFSKDAGFDLTQVILPKDDVEGFYLGYTNRIIWPLFHDLQSRCNFDPSYWEASQRVETTFATVLSNLVNSEDLIWVHDYHLLGLGAKLQAKGVLNRCAFFLHIPFPAPDIFLKLPWRNEVLSELLAYDLIGFQTERDRRNFLTCLDEVLHKKSTINGSLATVPLVSVQHNEKTVKVGYYPISIDYNEFSELAALPEVKQRAIEVGEAMKVAHLVISVDRLDYTKGIPHRIRAVARMLELFPELIEQIAFIQIVVPSREDVTEYRDLRAEIEQLVTKTNGAYAKPGWTPVHHFFRSITREELVAYYAAAEIALVTPLKDGMNLVAKEFCASRPSSDGVLVLSEFAGAASEFFEPALLVNPYDIDGVARALADAVRMPPEERGRRMGLLQSQIRKYDVHHWANAFLLDAGWKGLSTAQQSNGSTIWERLRRALSVFDA